MTTMRPIVSEIMQGPKATAEGRSKHTKMDRSAVVNEDHRWKYFLFFLWTYWGFRTEAINQSILKQKQLLICNISGIENKPLTKSDYF